MQNLGPTPLIVAGLTQSAAGGVTVTVRTLENTAAEVRSSLIRWRVSRTSAGDLVWFRTGYDRA
ncbi:hypothetical protein ACFL59_00335 [Planctomycetota bacterium]